VSTKVIRDGDKDGLEFVAQQKPWYPQYVRTGLGLEDDFDGDSFYNLGLGVRTNDVGWHGGYADVTARLGRNTSLAGEFVDPFTTGGEFFYALDGFIDRRSLFLGNNGDLLAEYGRRRIQGGIAVGYGFYRSWEARVGIRRGAGEVFRRVGSPELPETNFQVADIYSRLVRDTLDDIDFPQSGALTQLAVSQSIAELGGKTNYTELSGQLVKPFSLGTSNIIYRGEFSYTDGIRPAGRSFTLGGFLDLSGYTQNSVVASQYMINRLMFLEELDSGSALLGYKLFGGASLELTSLQSDLAAARDRAGITSGSVFLGANTPVLPVYLGIGFAEGGNRSVYLNVGRVTSGGQRNEGG
jgi:NTE family protein